MPCDLPLEMRRAIGKYIACQYRYRKENSRRHYSESCTEGLRNKMPGQLGSGVHRTVFPFVDNKKNSCVVKVATGYYGGTAGEEANLTEARFYYELDQTARKNFWPPYHSEPRGWWITGPEVDTSTGVDEDEIDSLISDTGCQDVHGGNVGYFKRRPVVLDYGFEGASCGYQPPMHTPIVGGRRVPLPKYALRRAARMMG